MKKNIVLQDNGNMPYKGIFQSHLMNIYVVWARNADNSNPHEKWNYKKHFHNFYELHIAQEGNAQIEIDEHRVSLKKGSYLLFPPKHPHSFHTISPDYAEFVAGFYVCFFETNTESLYIRTALEEYSVTCPLPCNSHIYHYANDCLRHIQIRPLFPSGVAMNLLLLLIEIAKQIMPNYMTKKKSTSTDKLLNEINSYISSNIANGVNTSSVADHVHFSERHLNRLLQTELQMSVNDLILAERINRIRMLLETTDLTLEAIAELTGYTNAYNMSRAFKKYEGTTPGNYRKALHMS